MSLPSTNLPWSTRMHKNCRIREILEKMILKICMLKKSQGKENEKLATQHEMKKKCALENTVSTWVHTHSTHHLSHGGFCSALITLDTLVQIIVQCLHSVRQALLRRVHAHHM